MTKDVLITIRGVHTLDHEDNDVEMIIRGDYYRKTESIISFMKRYWKERRSG